MRNKNLNCWEYMKCGREPSGKTAKELGVCPATTKKSMDGLHQGVNAGRSCWAIAGTYCGGEIQGVYSAKIKDCAACDFFQKVVKEEMKDSKEATNLLQALKDALKEQTVQDRSVPIK